MNSLEIPLRDIYIEYPDCWDEISEKDAPYIGKLLYLLEKQEIDVDSFRIMALDRFIGRKKKEKMPYEGDKAVDFWGNLSRLADTVNFFFNVRKTKGQEQYEVIPNFYKNLFPKVRVKGRRYYGPGDFLGEVSFNEFKDLLFTSSKWMETKDETYLDEMMAISYRRKRRFLWLLKRVGRYDGRDRIKYIPAANAYYAKRFKKVDIGIKYIFFQYVMGCLYMLKTDADGMGIEVDGTAIPFSLVFNRGGGKGSDNGIGLNGVKLALAETGVFGNAEDTGNTDVWEVLQRMYQIEIARREAESKNRS